MNTVRIALCQMDVVDEKKENLRKAAKMIADAAGQRADFVILPEMFVCPFNNANFEPNAEEPEGETVRLLGGLARQYGVYLIGGSIPEKENGCLYNVSYFFDRNGNILDKHRKMHLFDAILGDGTVYRESDTITPGGQVTVVETEFGQAGLVVCFDIRFSELFRLMGLQGAQMIFHPAAFNLSTGPAHWEISVRMRALDQQCFVISCAPARNMRSIYCSYANSMITGPDGGIITRMGTEEGVLVTEINLDSIERSRRMFPILSGRRTDIYDTILKRHIDEER